MKIQGIEAENFKLFTTNFHEIQHIQNAEMIMFNGPNGYGKTSIFDIIEFCLTGEIKRISDYSDELAIGKSEKFENKILISDETKKAFVKLWLEDNGQKIEICYSYNPEEKKKGASKENNPHNIFDCFNRTIICNGKEIEDYDKFIKEMQIGDIKEIFDKCCFLSQDEHLQFLKAAKKSKADALSFLFAIPDEWKKKQESVDKQLDLLSNRRKKNCYIVRLENEEKENFKKINELKELIQNYNAETRVIYQRLFFDKDIVWDREKVQFDEIIYNSAQKELDNLLYYAEHKTECVNYYFNMPYQNLLKTFSGDKNITYAQYPLEYTYRFIELVKQADILEEQYQKAQKARIILINIQERKYEDLNWSFIREEGLLEDDSIKIIKEQLGIVSNLEKAQGIIQNAMLALGQSRESLVKNANIVIEAGRISDKQCPLCGAPYPDRSELDKKIEKETELLSNISDDSVITIQNIKNEIYNNYLKHVEKIIQEIIQDTVSDEVYQNLQNAIKYKGQILELESILKKIGIELNKKNDKSISEGYNNLLTKIREALKVVPKEIELQLESRKFIEMYERFYGKNEQRFFEIDVEMLRNKKTYVEALNYDFYVAEISKKKVELEHIQKKIIKLNELIEELQGYRTALKEGVQEYKKKIISDIEPLLHIYTAKILQQKFNGKSIYIHTDEDVEDIQFVNSTKDNQDILYSMSSGQLSAVALSFLLCMNQVYGAHKACSILLIDDPVQTIDDVNMVGLVDILRFGFGDRQIFISTHEQSFEWFLRYRYSKAGKNVKIFNMKNLMLQEL